MRVVGKRYFMIGEVPFELAFEQRLPLLFCWHVEQILTIRLYLMFHMVDDLLSDPPLRFSLHQHAIVVLVAAIDDLPFQGVFLDISTLQIKGQIPFGLVQINNVAIDMVIGLQDPLHLLLIYLKKRIFAHKFMAVSPVHCSLAKIFLELEALLTLTLLEVLVPYAINLKVFGEFIHIEAILQLLPPLQLLCLQFQLPDQPLLPCLFVLKAIIGDPVPECESIVEFAMEGKLVGWLLLSLGEVELGVQGLFEVEMFLLGVHRRNIVLSICDYYVIEVGRLGGRGKSGLGR